MNINPNLFFNPFQQEVANHKTRAIQIDIGDLINVKPPTLPLKITSRFVKCGSVPLLSSVTITKKKCSVICFLFGVSVQRFRRRFSQTCN